MVSTSLPTNPTPPQVEKAEIQLFDSTTGKSLNKKIACQFNPNQLSVSKAASWEGDKAPKKDLPELNFAGGNPAKLSLDLFFDSTEEGEDVRKTTNKLFELVERYGDEKPPPYCRFVWGKITSFLAYVPDISLSFSMFLADGTPVRADAKMTFIQVEDEKVFKPQNPTSRSEARKTRIVVEGETLDWIAYEEYGAPSHWRHIAEANHLDNPMHLRSGQILVLPPLP